MIPPADKSAANVALNVKGFSNVVLVNKLVLLENKGFGKKMFRSCNDTNQFLKTKKIPSLL